MKSESDSNNTAGAVAQERLVLPLWDGKLYHGSGPHDDWGFIRDEAQNLIFIARPQCGEYSDEANEHRRNGTDPSQPRVDALLEAFEIVRRLADWSKKYPRQTIHSFSAKVDEQLIEIENSAKEWLSRQNVERTHR